MPFSSRKTWGVAAVSDGMGGAPAGDVASRIAVDRVAEILCAGNTPPWLHVGWNGVSELIAAAIEAAHEAIRSYGSDHPETQGLGATLTVLVADPEGSRYALGHVGDSRAYLLRDGRFEQLTRDDTLLQEHLEEGRIPHQSAERHPFGHILSQVLGMARPVVPQIVEGDFLPKDQLFLCSDGVTAVLQDREIGEMLHRGRLWPPDTVARAFMDSVNERGGPDNATAVLLRRL